MRERYPLYRESGDSQALAKYPLNATGCHVRSS